MSNRTLGLIKNHVAETAIGKFLLVKFGTKDGHVVPAAAAGDKIIGVSTEVDSVAGERCDVVYEGIFPVTYGGTVALGDALTANATGKAIVAAAGNRIIGFANVAGVSGDLGSVQISPGIA